MRATILRFISVLLLSGALLPAGAQVRSFGGSLSAGWSHSRAREFFTESREDPFTTLQMDYRSFVYHPRLLTYRVSPRLSRGFENIFTGQSRGSGIDLESRFLPQQPWPFVFHYRRFRRLGLTSGLGTSFARLQSTNEESTLGFLGQYLVPNHPNFAVQFTRVSADVSPELVLERGFRTRGNLFSLTGRDSRKGWNLNGSLSLQDLENLIPLSNGNGDLARNNTDTATYLFQARRPLGTNKRFTATLNRTRTDTVLSTSRAGQDYSALRGRFEYSARSRLRGWIDASLARTTLETSLGTLLTRSQQGFPGVRSANVTNRTVESELRYELASFLSLVGRNRFSQVVTPDPEQVSRGGNFLTNSVGISFRKSDPGWVLNSAYFLNANRTRFERSSPSDLLGHSFQSSFAAGDPSRVRAGAGFEWSKMREDAGAFFGTKSNSRRLSLSLSRRIFWGWVIEGYGGMQKRHFDTFNAVSDFDSRDYTALLRSPRFNVVYTRTIGSGDAWNLFFAQPAPAPSSQGNATDPPPISEMAAGGVPLPAHGKSAAVTASLRSEIARNNAARTGQDPAAALEDSVLSAILGSSNSSTAITASVTLNSHMTLRGTWRGQVQAIGNSFPNRYEQQEAVFVWRFRQMSVEAGYSSYRFDFGLPVFRKQILFRVTRSFRIF